MPTRTRDKGALTFIGNGSYGHTTTQPYNYGAGGTPSTTSSSTWSNQTDTRESMTDVIGSNGSVNPVNHIKRNFDGSIQSVTMTTKDSRSGQTGKREHFWHLGCGYYLNQYGASLLTLPDGKSVAISRVPTLAQEQLSVLNSLWELKDMASGLRRIRDHIMWARFRSRERGTYFDEELLGQLFPGAFKYGKLKPAAIVKSLVGMDLAWKFGWKPFLKDVQSVANIIGRLNDKLVNLAEGWYPCVGKHKETKSQTDQLFSNSAFGDKMKISCAVKRTTTTFTTAGAMRKLSPHALANVDLTKLYLAREQMGLSLNASRAWEAVPFSFVVDWLIPIQDFLDQFSGSLVPEEYVITGSKWIGRKTTQLTEVVMTLTPDLAAPYYLEVLPNRRVLTWEGEYSSYTRSTTESWQAPPLYIPELRLPDLGQWWTGAELLLARFRTIAR